MKFNNFETKTPDENGLDNLYDCLKYLNEAEWYARSEEELKAIQTAYSVIEKIYKDNGGN